MRLTTDGPDDGSLRWQIGFQWWKLRYWGPARLRWHWHETLPRAIAFRLPRKIALMAFVRVYSVRDSPGPDYEWICREWERRS